MRKMLLLLTLLLPVAHVQAQTLPRARVAQVDTSRYPEVTLYVSVTGADGRPVAGLAAGDFAVTEDGQPVTISGFRGGGASAISTVMVIDRSGSMDEERKIEGARSAARSFVRQMRPRDQTAVIAFDDRPEMVQPFTSDTARLDVAIRRIKPGGSTALYDSLIAGVDALEGVSGRRALLLLTDGRDRITNDDPAPASRASLEEAIARATSAGIAVQVIGLGDRDTDDLETGIDEQVLRRIADETGGMYFYAPSADQLADLYRRLSADMHEEYALTYRSPRPFYDGTRRDIRVHVGGAPAASSGYVERHLINVQSDPLVGFVLLLPVLAALLLPLLKRRPAARGTSPVGGGRALDGPVPIEVDGAAISAGARRPSDGSTILQPGAIARTAPRCRVCDVTLSRPGARFCSQCGAAQEVEPAESRRRVFCNQCGRPLSPDERFCTMCGSVALVLPVQQPDA